MNDERLTMGGDCSNCGREDIEIDGNGLCEECDKLINSHSLT